MNIKILLRALISCSFALWLTGTAQADVRITIDRNETDAATPEFRFKSAPSPTQGDAAAKAQITLLAGQRDPNGGNLDRLNDGRLPAEEDDPASNFFFRAGTDGGWLLFDLGSLVEVQQVNTYSWHPGTRAPQVYTLYASDGQKPEFQAHPEKGAALETNGWTLIAKVDTRPTKGESGGQYGVSISDTKGLIGQYRYLLFAISPTEDADPFGNTFYSEIDVRDRNTPTLPTAAKSAATNDFIRVETGPYQLTIDTTDTPDLSEWARQELAPVVREWYPRIVALLPSPGYEAPRNVRISFSQSMRGVAATGGSRIRCAATWFRQNLRGEAKGSIVHEMIHVVQQYGRTRPNPGATRAPGWLVEGMADYLRWFVYEPESHGAEITRRNIARARYDASYRITANFLNWTVTKYDKDLVRELNAAIRQGQYSEDLWKQRTGHALPDLGAEWKKDVESKLPPAS